MYDISEKLLSCAEYVLFPRFKYCFYNFGHGKIVIGSKNVEIICQFRAFHAVPHELIQVVE